jgi:hypothetical protein
VMGDRSSVDYAVSLAECCCLFFDLLLHECGGFNEVR